MRAALLCHDSSAEATSCPEQRQAHGCSTETEQHRLRIARFIRSFMQDIVAWERDMNDPKTQPFVTDMREIQRRAREHVEKGAVTPAYRGDVETAVKLLNEALATEIVCVLRYRRHHFMASGIHYQSVADEFMEHAQEEQQHADRIAERIRQLGGAPDFNPEGLLTRSHSQYAEGQSLMDMIKEDLIAERIAIESYLELIRFFGDNDPTSRRLMEEVLQQEEKHADDMATLMETLDAREPTAPLGTKH
jgi:bacterioferritin